MRYLINCFHKHRSLPHDVNRILALQQCNTGAPQNLCASYARDRKFSSCSSTQTQASEILNFSQSRDAPTEGHRSHKTHRAELETQGFEAPARQCAEVLKVGFAVNSKARVDVRNRSNYSCFPARLSSQGFFVLPGVLKKRFHKLVDG